MPRGDGTGPVGMGRMSGRGAGYCAGYGTPGFANTGPGGGFGFARGRGCGFGLGWRNRVAVPFFEPHSSSLQNEKDVLKDQARYLREALDSVTRRIESLEKERD
ncbi:MAG: DUF5320 domain-containing protein [Chitinispirillaceae bacterium]